MKFFCLPSFACKGKTDTLDFSCQKLEIIPDAVFRHAKSLEDLNLGINRLIDLPEGFFRMPKLQRLILSYNSIQGIPSGIGDLTNLVELDISNNELCDIPEEIGKCVGLRVLNISNNILTTENLPSSICNLSELTHFVMSKTDIRNLPFDIDKLVNLRFLNACECSLKALPSNIVFLKNLVHLDVGENSLTELPSGFGKLESLRELNLEGNDLTYLPDDLLKCSNLESLVVCRNRLRSLPSEIGDLTKLVELDAHTNDIEDVPTSIRRLVNLQILRLNNNHIKSLPMSIGSLAALSELYLSANELTSLPSSIGNLGKLTFLDVSSNLLTEIPSTIGCLSNLGTLLLRDNELQKLADEIGKLNKLRVLDVVDNELRDLPYTLVVLKQTLRAIYLAADRPIKISTLKESRDRDNTKVLVHYMLPQISYAPNTDNKSTLGGQRIRWATDVPENNTSGNSDVGFIDESVDDGLLERHDTPHPKNFASRHAQLLEKRKNDGTDGPEVTMRPLRSVLKNRPNSTASLMAIEPPMEVTTFMIRRSENGSLGWTIYGGVDCFPPYKDDDHGFFVKKLVPGGPAAEAGLGIGDKIVAVNGRPIGRCTHAQGTSMIANTDDVVLFDVHVANPELRLPIQPRVPSPSDIEPVPTDSTTDATDVVAVGIRCDYTGDVGFTINNNPESGFICIADVNPDGPAAATDKIRPGDRILSINGTNITTMPLHDVQTMIKPSIADSNFEVYLVVERSHFNSARNDSIVLPSTSLPVFPEDAEPAATTAPYKKGHARKPSEDFGIGGTPFLVELSREPVRAKSISDLTIVDNVVPTAPGNRSLDIEPTFEKISTPSKPLEPSTTFSDEPESTVSAVVLEKKILKPVPPPIAPKPKFLPESTKPPPVAPKPEGMLDINSRIKQFEEINNQLASPPIRSEAPPPEKKPLITKSEIEHLKLENDKTFIGSAPLACMDDEESVNGNDSLADEYDNMINRIITPTMPKVIRTKNAEKRATAAAAALGLSPSAMSNCSTRSESALSNASSVAPLDLNEIEKHRRWREARMNSIELMSKRTDDLLNDYRIQMSRLSNISEDHTVPSPIPTK
uniref:PDZ domain-containing protein n=1 Tax=Panagrellus redivivus TaxID=6233 RepID=A0A7E4V6U0_PANRE